MFRYRTGKMLVPVFLLAATLFGCESRSEAPQLLPTSPENALLTETKVEGFTLVNDPLLPGLTAEDLTKSALIGAGGGQVSVLGHTLTVPAGAVSVPTLFTLNVLATGVVEVDLTATLGALDVGSKGFAKRVPVTLTYSRATNVNPGQVKKLTVVRINSLTGYKNLEAMPSVVDTNARTVTTELDHFSRYCLATP